MNFMKERIAQISNPDMAKGNLESAVKDADVLIGLSAKGVFSAQMIKSMADKPIVFALANPEPEISYKDALEAGAFIVATGRSDTPNQVNNLSAFPGVMRGILEVNAKDIDEHMLLAASKAIARSVGKNLSKEFIMPDLTNSASAIKLAANVAAATAEAAIKNGLARNQISPDDIRKDIKESLKRYKKLERLMSK